ncbi:MAG TPA: hypothetical protein VNZ52_13525 [Candidatus Thermoplasmatota archaeon]|nr:hypothetical protein [Candidatus Thermoplasmatota archaeon]
MPQDEERKMQPGKVATAPGLTDEQRAHSGALEEAARIAEHPAEYKGGTTSEAGWAHEQSAAGGPGDAPVGPRDDRDRRIRMNEHPDKER